MIRLALFAIIALFASINAQSWNTCGGAGYDLSSLIGRELSLTTNYFWLISICGSIRNATDTRCYSDPEAIYGSMFCQRDITGGNVYTLSNWNETVSRFKTQWVALPNGVSMRTQVGERCPVIGNLWREVTIQFVCNTQASTPQFISISEPETCWYVAVVHTSAACTTVGPTMSNQIGSSFYSHTCGGDVFDLTSLTRRDLFYDNDDNHLYWLRVCALVNETRCAAAAPTSFCQLYRTSTTAVDVSDFNSSVANLYTVTPVGLDIDLKSGAPCGGMGLRQSTYHLICNPRATEPILSDIYEAPVCWYHAVIQTSAVCTGSNNPAMGYCGGGGYDMTPIADKDLYLQSTTGGTSTSLYNWFLHPCGPVSPWFTLACQGTNTMFCQQSVATNATWSLAVWNGTIAATATWMAIDNGVQLYVQTGDMCPAASNLPRDVAVQFKCNRTAIYPWFEKVTEPETCYYVAVVHTEAACDTVSATAPNTPGSTFLSTTCGGSYFDLSDIRDEIGDLTFDTNPGQADGYDWYLELCGAVSQPRCASVQPTMFCQAARGGWGTNAYSIAAYNESALVQYTINDNGLTMKMQTGTPCGAIPRRAVTINIICDGANPAFISSIREIEVCHYVAIIHGRCDYGSTEPFSTRAPAIPSSSSSTGGGARSSSSANQPTGRSSSSAGVATSVTVTVTSSVNQPTSIPVAQSSTAAAIGDSTSSSSTLSGGAIAGIVIGSIVGGLLLLAVCFFLCCGGGRSKSKFNEMHEDHNEVSRTDNSHTGEAGEVEMETHA